MAIGAVAAPTLKINNPQNAGAPTGTSVAKNIIARASTRGGGRGYVPKAAKPITGPGYRRPPQSQRPTARKQSANNYGLNTSDKTPYNPLASPFRTQGQFNKGVLKLAEQEYKPSLQNIAGEEAGEKGVTGERQADLGKIYDTYSQEAQQAFNDAKSALGEIAAKNQASDQGAQQTLQAALSSTGAPPTQQTNALGTALAEGQIGSGALAGLQSAVEGQSAQMENVPAVARTEQMGNEMKRDQVARENLSAEREKVVGSIPNLIEKARQSLLTNEENRQGLAFQQQLANKQFGLSSKAQGFNEGLQNRQQRLNEVKTAGELGMNREKLAREFSIHEQEVAAQSGLNIEKLALKRQEIAAKRGEAEGKRAKNAIGLMTSFLKPNKNEYMPEQQTHEPNQVPYKRDPNVLFKQLIHQGGLNNNEAIELMLSSGHPEVEKYAREYQRQEQEHRNAGNVPKIKLPKL